MNFGKHNLYQKIFIIILIIFSGNEIFCYKCGSSKLKVRYGYANATTNTSKRNLGNQYTNIKIGIDYTDFKKPNNMTTQTFKKLKMLIEDTKEEFQKILKIQHLDVNLAKSTLMQECELTSVSNNYNKFLYDYDYMIFPTLDYKLDDYVIAAAKMCLVVNTNNRPCAGNLYLNAKYISFNSQNFELYYKHVLFHELTHALIFHPIILDNLRMLKVKNKYTLLVNSPKVLQKARAHFGCLNLEGLPLENQGGEGTFGFHWEERYMLGDYMISRDFMDNVISDITLALFEDSGFYQVNYYTGGLFKFGKNKGCNFFDKDCIENGKILFDEFCSTFNETACTQSKTSKGICNLFDYSIYGDGYVPDYFSYFDNPNYGGYYTTDFCPVYDESFYENLTNLYYTTSCSVGSSTLPSEYGEKIGSNSFCFMSSLLPSSSNYVIESKPICYEIECDKNNKKINVHIGNSVVNCPTNGGIINSSGFKGEIKCPKYEDLCGWNENVL